MTDFNYIRSVYVPGRGQIYIGQLPFENPRSAIGQTVMIDGKARIVRGVEYSMTWRTPVRGDEVGLLVSAPDAR